MHGKCISLILGCHPGKCFSRCSVTLTCIYSTTVVSARWEKRSFSTLETVLASHKKQCSCILKTCLPFLQISTFTSVCNSWLSLYVQNFHFLLVWGIRSEVRQFSISPGNSVYKGWEFDPKVVPAPSLSVTSPQINMHIIISNLIIWFWTNGWCSCLIFSRYHCIEVEYVS